MRLQIANIRCHKQLDITFQPGINFICGPNGCGKTSILEAISLFSPMKTLRGATLETIISANAPFFEASLSINSECLRFRYAEGKSYPFLNHTKIPKTQFLNEISLIWLTQKIILNFWQDLSCRRGFFDRICAYLYSEHAVATIKYEKVKMQRRQMIEKGEQNSLLLETYNQILIEEGTKITTHRKNIITLMRQAGIEIDQLIDKPISPLNYISFEGPHTEKITLRKAGTDLIYGSSGEQSKALIAAAFAGTQIIPGKHKVLMLDDIFNGIDDINQEWITQNAKADYILITTQQNKDKAVWKCK